VPLELFIALRYLKARRKGVFTLLTSIIAIGGITLGVAALIITLGVMSGFHADIKEKILGVQPHLIVLKNNYEPFRDYKAVLETINANKHVTASAPFIYGQTIIRHGQSGVGAAVKGIDAAAEDKLVSLNKIVMSDKPGPTVINDGEILLETGVYGQIAGDLNADNKLIYSGPSNDRGLIISKINNLYSLPPASLNSTISGYYAEDLNMNGVVKYSGPQNDQAIILTNISTLTNSTTLTSIYYGQVPVSYSSKSLSTIINDSDLSGSIFIKSFFQPQSFIPQLK